MDLPSNCQGIKNEMEIFLEIKKGNYPCIPVGYLNTFEPAKPIGSYLGTLSKI